MYFGTIKMRNKSNIYINKLKTIHTKVYIAKRILPSFTHIYQWSPSHIKVLKVLHLLFRAIHTYNILDTLSGFLCFAFNHMS